MLTGLHVWPSVLAILSGNAAWRYSLDKPSGHALQDISLSTCLSGHTFLDMPCWTCFSGHAFLDVPFWTSLSGQAFLDMPSGHTFLDKPFWTYLFERKKGSGHFLDKPFGTSLSEPPPKPKKSYFLREKKGVDTFWFSMSFTASPHFP